MLEAIVICLLPFAAWTGWRAAMKSEARELRANKVRASYFEGLQFLLNDQSDKALETFITLPTLDHEAFDSQLMIGTLFRKRGEIDRALHLHQQLFDHAPPEKKERITFELAEDFKQAGMYVQAQMLYECLDTPTAKMALARIYEILGLWQKAIDLAAADNILIAHYFCELFEIEKKTTFLTEALKLDFNCARAHFLRAQEMQKNGENINAISELHTFSQLRPDLIPDILPLLKLAYDELNRSEDFISWLLEQPSTARLNAAILDLLSEDKKGAFLRERLTPMLIPQYLVHEKSELSDMVKERPRTTYKCEICGFRHSSKIIWQCPACYSWSSFRPIYELRLTK